MTPAAIEFKEVQKTFGFNFTLGPLSLDVPRGSIFGLIGPNGAGKSTAINMLMGLGEPGFGSIRVLDCDLRNDEVEVKLRTAFVSPDMDYRAWGTVGRAIDFVRGFYPDWNAARCEELQFAFGLHRQSRVEALSFGARMKLALILALSREAELLVLDEPTLGLDAVARRQLFSELLRFMNTEGRTILISSHQLADLERFADHVAIMNKGKVLSTGRVDRLLERYRLFDTRIRPDTRIAAKGVQVLDRSIERAKILLDRDSAPADALRDSHVEVVAEIPLSLEELFLNLIKSDDTSSGWWPQMSAA